MKVLFLDIDGPLNNQRCVHSNGSVAQNLHELRIKSDPIFLGFLQKKLNLHHGIRIVLISSWRNLYSISEIEEELMLPIYSCTEIDSDKPRATLIEEWLSKHDYVKTYVIVDDDVSLYRYTDLFHRLVCPSTTDGMMCKDMDRVIGLLELY